VIGYPTRSGSRHARWPIADDRLAYPSLPVELSGVLRCRRARPLTTASFRSEGKESPRRARTDLGRFQDARAGCCMACSSSGSNATRQDEYIGTLVNATLRAAAAAVRVQSRRSLCRRRHAARLSRRESGCLTRLPPAEGESGRGLARWPAGSGSRFPGLSRS
jgi:hypothetical protein